MALILGNSSNRRHAIGHTMRSAWMQAWPGSVQTGFGLSGIFAGVSVNAGGIGSLSAVSAELRN